MKCGLISIFVVVLVASSQEDDQMDQKMAASVDGCIKESKVDPNLVVKLKDEEFTDNKELKCFIKCLYVKVGAMSETGELNIAELKKTLDAEDINKLDKCKDQKGADPCETAYLVAKCTEGK